MVSSATSNQLRVRDKYISRACNECQRRKRKCSGKKDCQNCRHWATDCVFSEPRGSRPCRRGSSIDCNIAPTSWSSGATNDAANLGIAVAGVTVAPPAATATATATAAASGRANGVRVFRSNGTLPEQSKSGDTPQGPEYAPTRSRNEQQSFVRATAPHDKSKQGNAGNVGQTLLSVSTTTIGAESSSPRESVFECSTNFMTGASFFRQIDRLYRTVTQVQGQDSIKGGHHGGGSSEQPESTSLDMNLSIARIHLDVDETIEQIRSQDAAEGLQALDMFFTYVHPHYPCMNENHLRAQASAFTANDTATLTKTNAVQLATLLKYIMAVTSILSDTSTPANLIPGWQDFALAERLFNHATWLERANIVTVQTLLVKALYFMYAGSLNSAYDTMGTTVRLCFQLGLHDEPSWGDGCKFYDRIYRRRVFWSVYCLNHNVAQTRGLPELLRESDINVGLPPCVDDRMLYQECPPLPEMPATSPIPYLLEVIKLTRLSSEVCETMFGARSKKPVVPSVTADFDAKIVEFANQIPPALHWPPSADTLAAYEGRPTYLQNQAFVLHLRILHLRILQWREEMFSLNYSKTTAQRCIDLAEAIIGAVELSQSLQQLPSTNVTVRCQRHAHLHHLISALVPMICIIVRQSNGNSRSSHGGENLAILTPPAINLLNRALKILTPFSHHMFLARHVIQALGRPIKVARDIIEARRAAPAQSQSQSQPQPQPRDGGASFGRSATTTTFSTNTSGGGGTATSGPAPPVPSGPWNNGTNPLVDASLNERIFSFPITSSTSDLIQDLPMLWDDNGLDVWNSVNWTA